MKSAVYSVAAAALALSGGATAQFGNSSIYATGVSTYATGSSSSATNTGIYPTNATSTTSSSASPTASDPVFCPALAGKSYEGPLSVTYNISCDVNYGGTLIQLLSRKSRISKRQTTTPTSLTDCLSLCSALSTCVATAYDTNNPECYFYSSLGSAFQANGFEFAQVSNRANISTSTTSFSSYATGLTSGTDIGTTSVSTTGNATDGPFPYPTANTTTYSSGTIGPISTGISSYPAPSDNATSFTPYGSGTATSTESSSTSTESSSTSSSAVATSTSLPENFFCPSLNGQIYVDGLDIQYLIECNTNHFGITIEIDITLAKRQSYAATSLGDCLTECDQITGCVGTAFDNNLATCTFYSSVGAAYTEEGIDFAIVVGAAVTATPGETLTSTIYSTGVSTISSCAPTVTDCPYASVAVVTEIIPVSETVYICPTVTTFPAAPVACTSCPYAEVTGTIYSSVVETIYSCAPTVTDCPYASGVSTAGAVGGAGSTVYVTDITTSTVTTCPAGETVTVSGSTTVLASATVITSVYTTEATVTSTYSSGIYTITTTVATAVGTSLVNYPLPTSTGAAATTVTYGAAGTTITYGTAGATVTYGAAGTTTVTAGEGETTVTYAAPVTTISAGAEGTTVVSGAAGTTVIPVESESTAEVVTEAATGVETGAVTAAVNTVIPVAATTGAIVTQISDGQIQAPATSVASGSVGESATATESTLAVFTGMANRVTVGAGALVAGIAFLL